MRFDWVAVLEANSRRLADVAGQALDTPVPACPGWTTADLLDHVAGVQEFWASVTRLGGAAPTEHPVFGAAGDPVARVRAATADLVSAFRSAGPDGLTWAWWAQEPVPVGRSMRRQAHEALVHRADAEQAAGIEPDLASRLAADGVREWAELMIAGVRSPDPGRPQRVVLYSGDVGERCVVELSDGPPRLVDSTEADAIVVGAAADLDLLVWRRRGLDGLFVEGDRDLVAHLLSTPRLG